MRHLASLLLTVVPAVAQDTGIQLTTGVDSYLELPYDPQFVPQTGITVEAWITYDDQVPTGLNYYPTIARQHVSGGGNEAWFLRVNAGSTATPQLRFRASTTGGNILVNWNFASGQLLNWTHVAVTYDQSVAAMYVNGALVAFTPGNGLPLRDLGGELRVGKGATLAGGAANEVWNGQIDELRIWPFARTDAEILATMNEKLQSVPGLVATWNFDNTFVDSSTGQTLTEIGTVPFVANTQLYATPLMGQAFGNGTAGCLGDMFVSPTSAPTSGNAAFAVACGRLPANAFALWAAALGTLPSGFPILGIDYWLDPGSSVLNLVPADGFGLVRLGLPLPAGLAGTVLGFQAIPLDPCGTQGFTASVPLTVTLQ